MKTKGLRTIISGAVMLAAVLASNGGHADLRGATVPHNLDESPRRVESRSVEFTTNSTGLYHRNSSAASLSSRGIGQRPAAVVAMQRPTPSKPALLLSDREGGGGQIGLRLVEEAFNAGLEREFRA